MAQGDPFSQPPSFPDDLDHLLGEGPLESSWEMLSAYLDGEVSTEEADMVEQWLAEHPDGTRLLHQWQQLHSGLADLPAPAMSPQKVDWLVNDLMDSHVWLPLGLVVSRRSLQRWGKVVAGCALLASGWGAWRWQQQPQLMVSLESPPLTIPSLPVKSIATKRAEAYLFVDKTEQDAFAILFTGDEEAL